MMGSYTTCEDSGKPEMNFEQYLIIGTTKERKESISASNNLREALGTVKTSGIEDQSMAENQTKLPVPNSYQKSESRQKLSDTRQSTPPMINIKSCADNASSANTSEKTTPTSLISAISTPDTVYTAAELLDRPKFYIGRPSGKAAGMIGGVTKSVSPLPIESEVKNTVKSMQAPKSSPSPRTFAPEISPTIVPRTNETIGANASVVTVRQNPYRNPIIIPKHNRLTKETTLLFPYSSGEISSEHEGWYKQIVDCLIQNLERNPKTEQACEDVEFKLWMAGSSGTAASPSIVVISQRNMISQVKTVLCSSHITDRYNILLPTWSSPWKFWKRQIYRAHSTCTGPYFNLYLLGRDDAPRIFLGNTCMDSEERFDDINVGLCCGSKIFDVKGNPRATLTCLLRIGNKICGLTIAHAFDINDKSGQISVAGEGVVLDGSHFRTLIINRTNYSGGKQADLDWILIDVAEKQVHSFPNHFSGEKSYFSRIASSHPSEERDVLIYADSDSRPVSGNLLCGTTYSRPGSSVLPVALWSVELVDHRGLQKGDSGSLVVDATTNEVYGYVIALDFMGLAQVIPLHNAVMQIQELFYPNEVLLVDYLKLPQCAVLEDVHNGLPDGTSSSEVAQVRHLETSERSQRVYVKTKSNSSAYGPSDLNLRSPAHLREGPATLTISSKTNSPLYDEDYMTDITPQSSWTGSIHDNTNDGQCMTDPEDSESVGSALPIDIETPSGATPKSPDEGNGLNSTGLSPTRTSHPAAVNASINDHDSPRIVRSASDPGTTDHKLSNSYSQNIQPHLQVSASHSQLVRTIGAEIEASGQSLPSVPADSAAADNMVRLHQAEPHIILSSGSVSYQDSIWDDGLPSVDSPTSWSPSSNSPSSRPFPPLRNPRIKETTTVIFNRPTANLMPRAGDIEKGKAEYQKARSKSQHKSKYGNKLKYAWDRSREKLVGSIIYKRIRAWIKIDA